VARLSARRRGSTTVRLTLRREAPALSALVSTSRQRLDAVRRLTTTEKRGRACDDQRTAGCAVIQRPERVRTCTVTRAERAEAASVPVRRTRLPERRRAVTRSAGALAAAVRLVVVGLGVVVVVVVA
jgi:hypothetical protein